MTDHDRKAALNRIPEIHRADIQELLIDAEAIDARLEELAVQVDRDYAGRDLLIVGVLKGAIFVMSDLARKLTITAGMDFMACSSYGSSTSSSGTVRILKDLDDDIEGRDVLIVEDIVDSGLTLDYLVKNLRSRKPASLEIFALLTKPSRRKVDLPLRYVGFEVPDVFVVGYGLDFAERYRGLPHIVTLREQVYAG
ncbi:MAG: hypoxanthine phosphoribosyltransferase [Nitriliruptoraceae bacterium]